MFITVEDIQNKEMLVLPPRYRKGRTPVSTPNVQNPATFSTKNQFLKFLNKYLLSYIPKKYPFQIKHKKFKENPEKRRKNNKWDFDTAP